MFGEKIAVNEWPGEDDKSGLIDNDEKSSYE